MRSAPFSLALIVIASKPTALRALQSRIDSHCERSLRSNPRLMLIGANSMMQSLSRGIDEGNLAVYVWSRITNSITG